VPSLRTLGRWLKASDLTVPRRLATAQGLLPALAGILPASKKRDWSKNRQIILRKFENQKSIFHFISGFSELHCALNDCA
jgi:hypothetical protein